MPMDTETVMKLTAGDLVYLAPELTLIVFAVVLSLMDLLLPASVKRHSLGWLSLLGVLSSAAFVVYYMVTGNGAEDVPISLLHDSYRIDDFANLVKLVLLAGGAFVLLVSIGRVRADEIHHQGEYYYLFLPAILGGMMMASSGDMITLYVGLETMSITTYILVGMRKKSNAALEGAFKYVVLGGIASAFILYGMSFLYGMTGSTHLGEIRNQLMMLGPDFTALIYVSFFLLIAGFGFKVAAAPFHMWAPDVYQGAATPVTAFLSVVSKAAGFAILFRVIFNVYVGQGNTVGVEMPISQDIFNAVGVLAVIAMVVGNLSALRQTNAKRMLAFSGVANAGYLLVALSNFDVESVVHWTMFDEFIFYLIAYLFMNIGLFAVLMAVSEAAGNEELSAFSGLYYRAPWTAVAAVIFVLSLAGLPVTGGFFGKLYILLGTMQVEKYWLAIVLILTSVVSFYYYFGIIRQMFMRRDTVGADIKLSAGISITIWVCAVATLVMGFMPHLLLDYVREIFQIQKDFFF